MKNKNAPNQTPSNSDGLTGAFYQTFNIQDNPYTIHVISENKNGRKVERFLF